MSREDAFTTGLASKVLWQNGAAARSPRPCSTSGRLERAARDGGSRRVTIDEDRLEKGLAQLVLTLVDFLRQLMERQALRRMAGGSLTDEEVERLGVTFLRLSERMDELKDTFGLDDEDLNLRLGPLGDLM